MKRRDLLKAMMGGLLGAAALVGATPRPPAKHGRLTDANSLDGLNISFAAIDELHAHKTADVWQAIDTGMRPKGPSN